MELHIPKLSISGTYDLKRIFMNMGVTDVFSDRADLSGITGNPDMKVSKVSLSAETTIYGFLKSQLPYPKLTCEILLIASAGWYSEMEHLSDQVPLNSLRLLQDLETRMFSFVWLAKVEGRSRGGFSI